MTAESQLLRTINQFIGPCAHGSDPYDRCEECEWLSPIEAKVVALNAEVERLKVALEEERALACEEPDPQCSCPGCGYAREKAALKEGDR